MIEWVGHWGGALLGIVHPPYFSGWVGGALGWSFVGVSHNLHTSVSGGWGDGVELCLGSHTLGGWGIGVELCWDLAPLVGVGVEWVHWWTL